MERREALAAAALLAAIAGAVAAQVLTAHTPPKPAAPVYANLLPVAPAKPLPPPAHRPVQAKLPQEPRG
jgi:hypothetical protein